MRCPLPELSVQSNITQPQTNATPLAPKGSSAWKVAVIGNFSGLHPSGEQASLLKRKHHRITKDNFEEVFERLNVQLKLAIFDNTIRFEDIDDLNPDYIYQNVAAFSQYRDLIEKLQSKAHFQSAVAQLQAHGLIEQTQIAAKARDLLPENLLDSVLSSAKQHSDAGFSVEALIRQTIAPHIETQLDPRAEEYIAAVEAAASDLLRSIMHASEFKQLEASWRCIDLINRKLDTDRACHLHILDANLQAIKHDADTHINNIEASELYRNLIADKAVAGNKPYDAILLDINMEEADAELLQFFTRFAQAANIRLLTGAAINTSGYSSVEALLDDQAAQPQSDAWQQARNTAGAQNLFACTPPFMIRLPYGAKTSPIDSLRFEELPNNNAKKSFYLWANSAYLVLMTLVNGNNSIDGLPFHVTFDNDGDELLVPTTGAYLPAKAVEKLENTGLTVVQSVKNSDAVLVQRWVSFSG